MSSPRECRCGAILIGGEDGVPFLIQHVFSEQHRQGLAERGIFDHNHSYLYVNAQGVPMPASAPDAVRVRKPGCPACGSGMTPDTEARPERTGEPVLTAEPRTIGEWLDRYWPVPDADAEGTSFTTFRSALIHRLGNVPLPSEKLARAVSHPPVQPDRPTEYQRGWRDAMDARITAPQLLAAAAARLAAPPVQPVPSGLDVEPGHNHTTGGYPTFPVFREACPLGCDALRAGEIAANTGKRPNLTVVDPFVEVAAMQAVQAARLAHPVEGSTESGEER